MSYLNWKKLSCSDGKIFPHGSDSLFICFENTVYVFGGYIESNNKPLNEFYKYDILKNEWSEIFCPSYIPQERNGASGSIHGRKIYVFGGWKYGHLSDMQAFSVDTCTWEEIPINNYDDGGNSNNNNNNNSNVSLTRCYQKQATYQDSIFIFGGLRGGERVNDLLEFNVNTRCIRKVECMGDVPEGRSGCSIFVLGEAIYIYGGYGKDGRRYNDMYRFNVNESRWKKLECSGDVPTPTSGHCGMLYNNSYFLFGGSSAGTTSTFNSKTLKYYNQFSKFNVSTQTWKSMSSINGPDERSFCGCTIWNGKFILYGGVNLRDRKSVV